MRRRADARRLGRTAQSRRYAGRRGCAALPRHSIRGSRRFRRIRVSGRAHALLRLGAAGLGIRRTVLHSSMVEAATAVGVHMLWGTPVGSICPDGVCVAGGTIPARWIVGADGFHSRVRSWSGLAVEPPTSQRFGFRIHYRVAPWSEYMELHWGAGCQIYVTPIGPREVCAALISRNPRLRLDEALAQFPQLAARLTARRARRRNAAPSRPIAAFPASIAAMSRSSATPPVRSMPSPAKGCASHSTRRSRWPIAWHPEISRVTRPRTAAWPAPPR
jgi:2-polyprenyl-6-methoxyphenol hydroxylase-like FAD-dependent oxidoreductase